eukprot:GFYU01015180.1.p1 GENE.GFYU01015180.1~~GFYU01015180.1.p1  ORF type:complete len:111 (-),score=2.98 GFYU01015180.1:14-346(-)
MIHHETRVHVRALGFPCCYSCAEVEIRRLDRPVGADCSPLPPYACSNLASRSRISFSTSSSVGITSTFSDRRYLYDPRNDSYAPLYAVVVMRSVCGFRFLPSDVAARAAW